MKKSEPKKQWKGHITLDSKTGKSEWKMKRDQETRDYRKEPLKGEHLHNTTRRKWKVGFKRLAHDLARKNKQSRRSERKGEDKIKRK